MDGIRMQMDTIKYAKNGYFLCISYRKKFDGAYYGFNANGINCIAGEEFQAFKQIIIVAREDGSLYDINSGIRMSWGKWYY